MRVIIAGGRDFQDYPLLKNKCDTILESVDKKAITIICGTAKGADTLGEWYALEKKFKIEYFKPDWSIGRKAGVIRNQQMAENADALIAFWDGKSRGTMHMIRIAKEKGLKVRVINY